MSSCWKFLATKQSHPVRANTVAIVFPLWINSTQVNRSSTDAGPSEIDGDEHAPPHGCLAVDIRALTYQINRAICYQQPSPRNPELQTRPLLNIQESGWTRVVRAILTLGSGRQHPIDTRIHIGCFRVSVMGSHRIPDYSQRLHELSVFCNELHGASKIAREPVYILQSLRVMLFPHETSLE